jgi:hypothetical protein
MPTAHPRSRAKGAKGRARGRRKVASKRRSRSRSRSQSKSISRSRSKSISTSRRDRHKKRRSWAGRWWFKGRRHLSNNYRDYLIATLVAAGTAYATYRYMSTKQMEVLAGNAVRQKLHLDASEGLAGTAGKATINHSGAPGSNQPLHETHVRRAYQRVAAASTQRQEAQALADDARRRVSAAKTPAQRELATQGLAAATAEVAQLDVTVAHLEQLTEVAEGEVHADAALHAAVHAARTNEALRKGTSKTPSDADAAAVEASRQLRTETHAAAGEGATVLHQTSSVAMNNHGAAVNHPGKPEQAREQIAEIQAEIGLVMAYQNKLMEAERLFREAALANATYKEYTAGHIQRYVQVSDHVGRNGQHTYTYYACPVNVLGRCSWGYSFIDLSRTTARTHFIGTGLERFIPNYPLPKTAFLSATYGGYERMRHYFTVEGALAMLNKEIRNIKKVYPKL